MIEVDVVAVAELCTRFLPGMVERGRGALLNVASTAAFQPLPGQAAYGAGKAFVLSYTKACRRAARHRGQRRPRCAPGRSRPASAGRPASPTRRPRPRCPSIMWVSAAEVAKAAVDGLAKGRRVVIPGAANRVGAAFAQVTRGALLLPILARNHPGLK